jgi:hypothetical protein
MSILQSYPKGTPKADDLLLGTSTPLENTNDLPITQNFSVSDVASFANSYSLGYTVYTALLTQAGATAPVATILQNTTGGTFTWTRQSAGNYTITASSALFTANKTMVFVNAGHGEQNFLPLYWERTSTTTITLNATSDGELEEGSFEIRIYS